MAIPFGVCVSISTYLKPKPSQMNVRKILDTTKKALRRSEQGNDMPPTPVRYTSHSDDEAKIVSLFNATSGKSFDVPQWTWTYRENPDRKTFRCLAYDGDRLVSHSAAVPVRILADGKPFLASRIQNVMSDPEYRGQGIFFQTLDRLTHQLMDSGEQIVITYPNDNSFHTFIGKLEYRHLFDISVYASEAGSLRSRADARYRSTVSDELQVADDDLSLISSHLSSYRVFTNRTKAYLQWRFDRRYGQNYRAVRIFAGAQQIGLIIAKMFGGNAVDLVEIFVAPEALPFAISEAVKSFGPQISTVDAWLMPHYKYYRAMRELGFSPSTSRSHVVYKSLTGLDIPLDKEALYLSMSDSDVF
jgi:hypothetical protein